MCTAIGARCPIFVPTSFLLYVICARAVKALMRLDFIMEANTMDPDWSSLILIHIVCL